MTVPYQTVDRSQDSDIPRSHISNSTLNFATTAQISHLAFADKNASSSASRRLRTLADCGSRICKSS